MSKDFFINIHRWKGANIMQLESRKYKKKELYSLFGYESPLRSTGSKKSFERKLTECCKWNTENCKTTEINVIEVY